MTTYFIQILQGLLVTLGVSLGALVVAAVLGLAGAAAKLSPYRWLNWVGDIYSTVIRGVPDLVWMLLLYFGGQILINDIFEAMGYRSGPQINPFVAGVLTIGFVYGAYMTETFRGAIMSVPKGQSEAGWAYGMSRFYTFRRMVLPQMVRFALPSFTNNWLVLPRNGLLDISQGCWSCLAATQLWPCLRGWALRASMCCARCCRACRSRKGAARMISASR